MMKCDLQANRCPRTQPLLSRALSVFLKNYEEKELTIISIEPSLVHNIREQTAHLPISVNIDQLQVSDRDRCAWLDEYDETNFAGINVKYSFTLVKHH